MLIYFLNDMDICNFRIQNKLKKNTIQALLKSLKVFLGHSVYTLKLCKISQPYKN